MLYANSGNILSGRFYRIRPVFAGLQTRDLSGGGSFIETFKGIPNLDTYLDRSFTLKNEFCPKTKNKVIKMMNLFLKKKRIDQSSQTCIRTGQTAWVEHLIDPIVTLEFRRLSRFIDENQNEQINVEESSSISVSIIRPVRTRKCGRKTSKKKITIQTNAGQRQNRAIFTRPSGSSDKKSKTQKKFMEPE